MFATFLSALTFGMGTPWIFLSITKRFIEQYISLEETDDVTLAQRDVRNMKIEKSKKEKIKKDELLDDLNINDIHSKRLNKAPFIVVAILFIVSLLSYFGFKVFLIQKRSMMKLLFRNIMMIR